jgi:hypothetical protein
MRSLARSSRIRFIGVLDALSLGSLDPVRMITIRFVRYMKRSCRSGSREHTLATDTPHHEATVEMLFGGQLRDHDDGHVTAIHAGFVGFTDLHFFGLHFSRRLS